MKINAVDKIIIPQLFPPQDSILVQMMIRDISRKVELTEKDREAINLKPNPAGPGVIWKNEKVDKTEMEVKFTNAEISFLQDRVKSLDDQKKISPAMLDTCIKIRDEKTRPKTEEHLVKEN